MTAITLKDMRSLKYCAHGSREFARRHGLDWRRFVLTGIPVSELSHIDNAMLDKVIEKAKARESQNGRG